MFNVGAYRIRPRTQWAYRILKRSGRMRYAPTTKTKI
jgi:hypothetical protein